jgi:uncharacterized protein (DUF58 family)
MVRREEQPWQSRATLFVDNRQHVHRGAGAASSLEYAVSAAASIAVHLTQRGFRVRLVTAEGGEGTRSWHEHGTVVTEAGPILESLAVLQPWAHPAIDLSWLNDAHPTGLLVAVLGETPAADAPVLARMQHAARNPLALTLDVDRWRRGGDRAGTSPTVGLLVARGWRAVSAGPDEPVAEAWQRLGLTAGGTRTASPVAAALRIGEQR